MKRTKILYVPNFQIEYNYYFFSGNVLVSLVRRNSQNPYDNISILMEIIV